MTDTIASVSDRIRDAALLSPPRYCIYDDFLDFDDALKLRSSVEGITDFKKHEEYFFSQHDASLVRRDIHGDQVGEMSVELDHLYENGRTIIETTFRAVVSSRFTILVHKMSNGQVVGIHNDSPNHDRGRMENFRLMLYFDSDFRDEKGGILFLFSKKADTALLEAVRPNFNSAVMLPLTDFSYHAVGRVTDGVRYSLVVSYWAYPILESKSEHFDIVASVLHYFVSRGLDRIHHSGTTLLDHLYGTYRMLATWEVSFHIRIAGLLHSVFGRETSNVTHSGVDRGHIVDLCGNDMLQLVDAFSTYDIDKRKDAVSGQSGEDLFMLGIANELEQSETLADIERVRLFLSQDDVDDSKREIIMAELELRYAYIMGQEQKLHSV